MNGAIQCAGCWQSTAAGTGWSWVWMNPGIRTAEPRSSTAASGAASRQSCTEPTVRMRPESRSTATASARGRPGSMVMTDDAFTIDRMPAPSTRTDSRYPES